MENPRHDIAHLKAAVRTVDQGPPAGRGKAPFGRGPMFGGPLFGGGRGRRRRGDLRAALLLLLADEPRNGYQLMQAIEELSGGRWRPSPGSIYPTLSQLEDQGLIRASEREGGRLFEPTDAGRKHLEERHDHDPPWAQSDEPEAIGDLRTQLKQLGVAAMQVAHAGQEDQIARAAGALAEARRAIYRILAGDDDR
jgi:DNA-binding PadR family transcriptional regulator